MIPVKTSQLFGFCQWINNNPHKCKNIITFLRGKRKFSDFFNHEDLEHKNELLDLYYQYCSQCEESQHEDFLSSFRSTKMGSQPLHKKNITINPEDLYIIKKLLLPNAYNCCFLFLQSDKQSKNKIKNLFYDLNDISSTYLNLFFDESNSTVGHLLEKFQIDAVKSYPSLLVWKDLGNYVIISLEKKPDEYFNLINHLTNLIKDTYDIELNEIEIYLNQYIQEIKGKDAHIMNINQNIKKNYGNVVNAQNSTLTINQSNGCSLEDINELLEKVRESSFHIQEKEALIEYISYLKLDSPKARKKQGEFKRYLQNHLDIFDKLSSLAANLLTISAFLSTIY